MNTNETVPLPCPFCGSTKITVEWEACPPLEATDTNRRWFSECAQCCCQGPFCQKETQVIPAWNTRPARPSVSPVTDNPQDDEFYEKVEASIGQTEHIK